MNEKKMKIIGIIAVLLLLSVAMVGSGAAEIKDLNDLEEISLTYYKTTDTGCTEVTEVIKKENYTAFFGTSKIYTFSTADDINEIAERSKTGDWNHDITYIQMENINCIGKEMKSIPGQEKNKGVYKFNIYGNGKHIINYFQSGDDAYGLVKSVGHPENVFEDGNGCEFNNITLGSWNISSTSSGNVGCIVGYIHANDVWMKGCSLKHSTIISKGDNLGGLVGCLDYHRENGKYKKGNLYVYNCETSYNKIMGYGDYVGGIVGQCHYNIGYSHSKRTDIPTCLILSNTSVNDSKIGAVGEYVGGIAGSVPYTIIKSLGNYVYNCIIESAGGSTGGLFGFSYFLDDASPGGSIEDYIFVNSTSILSSSRYVGSIVGDVGLKWNWNVQSGYDNRVFADDCVIAGSGKIHPVCPGTDSDGDRITNYFGGGEYYVATNLDPAIIDVIDYRDNVVIRYYYQSGDEEKRAFEDCGYKGWPLVEFKKSSDDNIVIKANWNDIIGRSYKDISSKFIKNEITANDTEEKGYGAFSVGDYLTDYITEGYGVTEIGHCGIDYGYFYTESLTATFIQTRTSYYDGATHVEKIEKVVPVLKGYLMDEPIIYPPLPEGYTISRWHYEDGGYWSFYNIVLEDITLCQEVNEWCYHLHYINGTETWNSRNLGYNEEITLDIPSSIPEGKKFIGWNTKSDGTGKQYAAGQTVSKLCDYRSNTFTFYAQFENDDKVVLTFIMNDYGEQIDPIVSVSKKFIPPLDPVEEGYTFGGWYTNQECTSGNEFNFDGEYNENQTVYAKWTENTYTIKYNGNGNDSGSMEDRGNIPYSSEIVLDKNNFLKNGCIFTGWKDQSGRIYDDRETVSGLSSENGDTITLSAQWDSSHFTLSFDMNNHGKAIDSQTVLYGVRFSEPTEPTELGYVFEGWYDDENLTREFDFDTIYAENKVAYAKWSDSHYWISFDANGGTGSKIDDIYVSYQEELKLPSNEYTRADYNFIEWNTESDGTGDCFADEAVVSKLSPIPEDRIILYAQWGEKGKYALSFDMNGHGEQVPTIMSDSEGKFIEPQEKPFEFGYTFEGWYTNKEGTNKFDFTKPYTENQVSYAKWTANQCPVYLWDREKYVNVENLEESKLQNCVSYDKDTNTITLNGYTADFQTIPDIEDDYGAIYSLKDDDLHIVLAENSVNKIGIETYPRVGIYSPTGNIILSGTGKLVINVCADMETVGAIGIYGKSVTIENGTIEIITDTIVPEAIAQFGIFSSDSVNINGGTLSILIKSMYENSYGVYGGKNVTIHGGNTEVAGGQIGVISMDKFTMTSGLVNIVNSDFGIVANTLIDLENLNTGTLDIQTINQAFGTVSENKSYKLQDTIRVYAGSSFSDKTLLENNPQIINTIINNRYQYLWIGESDPEPPKKYLTLTTVVNNDEMGYINSPYLPIIEEGFRIEGRDNTIRINDEEVIVAVPYEGYIFEKWTGIPSNGILTTDITIMANFNEDEPVPPGPGPEPVIPTTTSSHSSSAASFTGEKVGNDFIFENATVVTRATLPGATSARITNNGSGDGWYKFTLSTDGLTGNGTVYFQVPLDVIQIKGYTINDVSLFGAKTTYLSTDGQYAKYSAPVAKDGAYTIGFEKGAASAGTVSETPVTETKPVEVSVELSGVTAMKVGDTTLFSAKNSDGSSAKFAWKSSDNSVATVDENGNVKAVKAGTATITVTNNVTGKTATRTITVAAKAEPETQTTKSPFPVLGILAGLGAAAVFLEMRRKL